ncbi:aldo/keto reductase [Paractinoplanes abujensis]|uniref:Aryl-alcohol dehydrogenase-like predicted oxidoreductase n=1 Tax=Paractinoplanes abujensis TaxID=882441 RepID=A0A7W7CS90_9ACTN|nr:aldo/keto reductase [Actinoplanes abujensis]MBB4693810.1 aryl-alcohol dehydrogenase-like predicted oxidoreductase [Actinoplanes abujensis]GID21534.1 aldo/keto reductase [Actinoplanes abujensis]
MQTRNLGRTGPTVSALGLGAMGMSHGVYGASERDESIATVHAALDAGVTLIDTGDFYGMGHNELLLAEALRGRPRDSYQLSVKFGALRGPDHSWGGNDGRPAAVKNFLAYSLNRLGTDYIDVYRPARLDPAVPIEDTVGAIKEMIDAGFVRHAGLSEVGADTIRRAHAVHPIADLQIEYSLISRAVEGEILPTLRELGIGLTAYGVLSRGLISGHWTASRGGEAGDFRGMSPRFSGDNLEHNLNLVEALRRVAAAKGCTVAQLAIAWVAAQGADIVPLVGARTRERLSEALPAVEVTLTADDLTEIEKAVPAGAARGDRYPTAMMGTLGTSH